MEKKLFVGGLAFSTTEDSLRAAFATVGTVASCAIIIDRETGRSKGFGFVEMSSEDEAKKAIETFDNKELDGRSVRVNEAKPREDRPRREGFGANRGAGGGDRGGKSFRRF